LLAGDAVVVAVEVAGVPVGLVVDPVAALEVNDVAALVVRSRRPTPCGARYSQQRYLCVVAMSLAVSPF